MAEQRLAIPDDVAALIERLKDSWKTTNGDVMEAANKLHQQARLIQSLKKSRDEAPIARITVAWDGMVAASMYAPGLPAGEYDVYL